MSCGPIVIGDTPETQINYGETIDLVLTYKNQDDTPTDLTTASVSIMSSAPPVIKEATQISIVDAAAGKVRFLLGREDAKKLRKGQNNWFRIQVIFGSQSDDVTPEIYIKVT